MEWGKIKTILIWIFVFVNIFLFYMYFKNAYIGKGIDDETILNTVEIMKSNDIKIEADIIPKNYENVKICNIENTFENVGDMLDHITKNNNAAKKIKNIKISENGISFVCSVKSDSKADMTADLAEAILEDTGILELADYKTEEKNDGVYFYLRFENMVFFDSYIRVCNGKNNEVEISGRNWLGDKLTEGSVAEAVSPAEILIGFASQHSGEKTTVKSITPGYYIGNRDSAVMTTSSPVWEISLTNGKKYYYDMRNGDLL